MKRTFEQIKVLEGSIQTKNFQGWHFSDKEIHVSTGTFRKKKSVPDSADCILLKCFGGLIISFANSTKKCM